MKKVSLPPLPMNDSEESFVRYIMLKNQREEIFALLEQHKLCLIPLKGLWFCEILYRDSASRKVNDLDILVRVCDLEKGGQMLESLGYRAEYKVGDRLAFGAIVETVYRRENSLPVELHTRVSSGVAAREFSSYLFQCSSNDNLFNNSRVLLPPFEETIISLVFHFRDHGLYMTDYQAEDVRRLFSKFAIDLEKCISLAFKYHCMIGLYTMLLTAGLESEAEIVQQRLGFSARTLILKFLTKQESTGFRMRLPVEKSRAAERAWRLFLHTFLARDSLKESAESQLEHLYYELKTLLSYSRGKN